MSTEHRNFEATQMKATIVSFVRKALHDQRGQVLPWLAMGFVGMIGMGGLSIDVGRAYVVHAQLQNYANAAVLAAAGLVYNTSSTTNASTEATTYSGSSGDDNASSTLGTVTTTVRTLCLNSLQPSGTSCPSTNPPPNAVRVVEKTTVPTYFMNMLGVHSLLVAASATASMQGQSQPWNVAIVLDATGSMSTTDANCGTNVTEFQCALNGIQGMLASTNPCKAGATSCTNAAANFHVALFGFPAVSTGTVSYENACSSFQTPSFQIYTLPLTTATSYTPIEYQEPNPGSGGGNVNFTGTYEVTLGASDADANGFVSDYYSPSGTNGLNTSSSIVKAITKCMQPIARAGSGTGGLNGAYSGGITYYASILYAAQSALAAEKTLNTGTNNAIIFLSDGQANLVAATADFPTSPFTAVPSTAGLNTLTGTGYYPDTNDECQQAIIAGQAAATAGTQVYSVAYGSEQTGCYSGSGNTDTTLLTFSRPLNATFTISQLTPCVTMENIASSLNNFYSDYNQSGSGSTCQDSSHTVTSLADIFLSIAASFTQPRLIPNTAT
jgi:Flp pilus assembly protein TadG